MRGSEGGIPYRTQRRPLTVHFAPRIGDKPVCATTAWRYQTTPHVENVTCRDCKEQTS